MTPYKINDEFTVYPMNNQVMAEMKLEPRLMKLLCLLVGNSGNLVSREEIVDKIWNGYGGGDEGLTQAISFLRKVLNDTDKTMIETVPKSGYIFRGKVEMLPEPVSALPAAATVVPGRGYISIKTAGFIIAMLLLLLIGVGYLYTTGRTFVPLSPGLHTNTSGGKAPVAP